MKQFALAVAATIFLITAWLVQPGSARAADNDPLTVFAVDISLSSPFLSKEGAAGKFADYARSIIRQLKPGHELQITTLGIPGFETQINLKARVGNESRTKARVLADGAAKVIGSIPDRYNAGEFPGQNFTSIVDFLESFDAYDCKAKPVHLIVGTDGVEWTPTFDGQAFAAGKLPLPQPATAFLEGCRVTMVGVGADLSVASDRLYGRLQPQWAAYLKAAGAVEVKIAGTRFGS